MEILIRPERPEDCRSTEAMVRRAFYNRYVPGCHEHLFLHRLRSHPAFLPDFSRVAEADGQVVGVICYYLAEIRAGDRVIQVPSFGPLCAEHRFQNRGIGRQLLQATLPLVKRAGYPGVVIMGEAKYYPRFGFVPAGSLGLTDAEGNTFDAFLALEFTPGALHIPGGRFFEPETLCAFDPAELQTFDCGFAPMLKAIRPCQWTYDNPMEEKNGYRLEYAEKHPAQFERLFGEYLRELAADDPALSETPAGQFTREIWDSTTDAAYLIRVGEDFAGLLVTSVPEEQPKPGRCHSYLQELYVAPAFRRRGIAGDIVLTFLRSQQQDCGFCMVQDSPAGRLWCRLLDEAGYRYELFDEDEVRVFCHVYLQ